MESSILKSTKKVLGLQDGYTAFDEDVMIFINAAFSQLAQLGVGPSVGFALDDGSEEWDDLALPAIQLGLVKTYIFLKVRMLFDPPTTSFLIEAMNNQIAEHEWRLNVLRENEIPLPVSTLQGHGHDW